jgi:hypothetical protein
VGYFGLLPSLTDDLPTVLHELARTNPATKIALDTVNPPGSRDQLDPILPHLDLVLPEPDRSRGADRRIGPREDDRVVPRPRREAAGVDRDQA